MRLNADFKSHKQISHGVLIDQQASEKEVMQPVPRQRVVLASQLSAYFLPLPFLLSAPLISVPLVSSPLVATPDFVFRTFDFLRWCSGIHSSWYPPAPVAVTVPTGALTVVVARVLRFLGWGTNVRYV